jgi:single-strand DNA-binding protein
MSCVNKVILVGNLGADPELRYTQTGRALCKLSVATSRRFKDAEGNPQEQTDWHRVSAWGKQGELCKTYLRKGGKVYVEGRLHNDTYTDKQGQKRFSSEIVSEEVVFLGAKNAGQGAVLPAPASPPPPRVDDVPF